MVFSKLLKFILLIEVGAKVLIDRSREVDSRGSVVSMDINEKGEFPGRVGEFIGKVDVWVDVVWVIIDAVVEFVAVIVVSNGKSESLVVSFVTYTTRQLDIAIEWGGSGVKAKGKMVGCGRDGDITGEHILS